MSLKSHLVVKLAQLIDVVMGEILEVFVYSFLGLGPKFQELFDFEIYGINQKPVVFFYYFEDMH